MFLTVAYSLSIRLILASINSLRNHPYLFLVSLSSREGKVVVAGDESPRVSTSFVFGDAKRKTSDADNAS